MVKYKRILAGLVSVITVFSMATTSLAAESGQTAQTGQAFEQGSRGGGQNVTEKMDTLLEQGVINQTLYDSIKSYMDENSDEFNALMEQDRISIYAELLENGIITTAQYDAIVAYMSEKSTKSTADEAAPVEMTKGEPLSDGTAPPEMTKSADGTTPPGMAELTDGTTPPEIPGGEQSAGGGRPSALTDVMSSELYENGIIDEDTQTAIQAYMENRQESMTEPEIGGTGVEQNVFALLLEKGIITQSQYNEIIEALSSVR